MYLLDTNALLFFLYDSKKLSKKASEVIYRMMKKLMSALLPCGKLRSSQALGNWEIGNQKFNF